MKNVKIDEKVWKKIFLLRIKNNKRSISEMLEEIVEVYESIQV